MVTLQGLLTGWGQKGAFWGARNVLCVSGGGSMAAFTV